MSDASRGEARMKMQIEKVERVASSYLVAKHA
jgi:hypothetical protein